MLHVLLTAEGNGGGKVINSPKGISKDGFAGGEFADGGEAAHVDGRGGTGGFGDGDAGFYGTWTEVGAGTMRTG